MGLSHSPRITTSGLTLCLDAANIKSYPGSGTTWRDLSGNGRNGTLTNGPTFSSSNGGSLVFDGSDDYVSTTYDVSWNNTNSVTINFVIKPASLSGNYPFLGKGPSNWEWQFLQNSGALQFVYWNTSGGHTNGPIPNIDNVFTSLTEWVYIDTVWNHVDNKLYFYKNASLINTTTWVDASINQNRTDGINIGGNIYQWSAQGRFWNGSFSGLKFYDRALTADEITQNFNALRGRYSL